MPINFAHIKTAYSNGFSKYACLRTRNNAMIEAWFQLWVECVESSSTETRRLLVAIRFISKHPQQTGYITDIQGIYTKSGTETETDQRNGGYKKASATMGTWTWQNQSWQGIYIAEQCRYSGNNLNINTSKNTEQNKRPGRRRGR